jgi:hypothetical protein
MAFASDWEFDFAHLRFGSLADIGAELHDVCFTPKADIAERRRRVR